MEDRIARVSVRGSGLRPQLYELKPQTVNTVFMFILKFRSRSSAKITASINCLNETKEEERFHPGPQFPGYRLRSLLQPFVAAVTFMAGRGAEPTRRFTSCWLRSQGVGHRRLKEERAGEERGGRGEGRPQRVSP